MPDDSADNIALEAEAYFNRNKGDSNEQTLVNSYLFLERYVKSEKSRFLEIGCGDGKNVYTFTSKSNCQYHGIDLSKSAINEAKKTFPKHSFEVAGADEIPYENGYFDIIYLGFFLYLTPIEQLTQIVQEVDRCLKDEGFVAITDFGCLFPHTKDYQHMPSLKLQKYNFEAMFCGFPQYTLIEKRTDSGQEQLLNHHQWVTTSVLQKNKKGFPHYHTEGSITDPYNNTEN